MGGCLVNNSKDIETNALRQVATVPNNKEKHQEIQSMTEQKMGEDCHVFMIRHAERADLVKNKANAG